MRPSVGVRGAAFLLLVCGIAVRGRAEADLQPAPPLGVESEGAASPEAPWPPPLAAELPDRDPARARIDAAWRLPGLTLEERVDRVQRAAYSIGIRELDGPARALLFDESLGEFAQRAELAVRLAPGLPAAHAAVADAKLSAGDLRGAAAALRAAVAAVPTHLEARAWAGVVGYRSLILGSFLLALLYLSLAAVASLPTLVRGLGASRFALSGPPALAALGCIALFPALVEGPAGATAGLAALAVAHGRVAKRIAAAAACGIALLALYPGIDRYAASQLALSADPIAIAAQRVEAGLATPFDAGAVLAAAASDPLAARAAALHAKRSGQLAVAKAYFRRVESFESDPEALNNAANVAFSLGDTQGAIALYEGADRVGESSVVLFNLAQAYGRAVRLDDQDRALLRAQVIDARTLDRLSGGLGGGAHTDVADIAIPSDRVFARTVATGQPAQLAATLRRQIAPGWLGAGIGVAALALALVLGAAMAVGGALSRGAGPRDFYADIARTLQAGVGDSSQRIAQLTRLRRQHARTERSLTLVALAMPGAAGLRWGRPVLAFFACLAFCGAVAVAIGQIGAPLDPLALGALPDQLARVVYAGFGCLYAISSGLAFTLRAED